MSAAQNPYRYRYAASCSSCRRNVPAHPGRLAGKGVFERCGQVALEALAKRPYPVDEHATQQRDTVPLEPINISGRGGVLRRPRVGGELGGVLQHPPGHVWGGPLTDSTVRTI